MTTTPSDTLLNVENLKVHFPIRKGFWNRQVGVVRAVDGVSFSIKRGETLGLVGESGCGKTTTGRALSRIYKPTEGKVLYASGDGTEPTDLATLPDNQLRSYWQKIRMVFQDPFMSLNPRMTVLDIVAEPMRIHKTVPPAQIQERVAELLRKVGLRPEFMRRYPHAFSGGQRQRIGIARALALQPELIIADEAVSALDVSVRAQILNLLKELQKTEGLTYLFVSHDLSVVEYLSDTVAVMYVGSLVEKAPNRALFQTPKHPYTEALLSAIPKAVPKSQSNRILLKGEIADPSNPPKGCRFHPRCPYAEARCSVETPALREVAPEHMVACHFAEKLSLRGVAAPSEAA